MRSRVIDLLGCASFECFDDGSAKFVLGPLETVRTFEGYGGRQAWFHNIANIATSGQRNVAISSQRAFSLYLGDGCAIPPEAAEAFSAILDEECVNLRWEEGDVLLVDNRAVQHGRRPSKPPRRILVAMCK